MSIVIKHDKIVPEHGKNINPIGMSFEIKFKVLFDQDHDLEFYHLAFVHFFCNLFP